MELTGDEPIGRFTRRQTGGECAYLSDSGCVPVDAEAGESIPQEVDEVATISAAGVEHAASTIEMPPGELVEQIDVDVAKSRAQLGAWTCHLRLAVA